MTPAEYRGAIRALGLTPQRPSYVGAAIHVDRDGLFHSVPDPDGLSAEERLAFVALLRSRLLTDD